MEHTYKGHIITPYPNQKVIFVEKALCDKDNPYITINQNAMQKAIQNLCNGYKSAAPFAMWCYFTKFKSDMPLYMSHHIFTNYTSLSKKAYDHAIKTLIEKRYLKKDAAHVWLFNENGF